MNPLTVGLVGAGKLGQLHARHWASLPNVRLVAVADPLIDNARVLAASVRAASPPPAFADLPTLLARARPDIVDICTPTPTHRPLIEQAVAARCTVFVEKPLARTLADCDALVDLVRQTGTFLMVGHVVRWFPAFAHAKAVVDSGGVGQPAAIRTAREAAFPRRGGSPQSWYDDVQQSGGVILDVLLHDFDWLRWCFGPVARVYARGLTFQPQHHGLRDYALVTLRFASGAVAHVTGSWAHPGPVRTTFEICGDGGLLEWDSDRTASVSLLRPDLRAQESPLLPSDDPYLSELRAFADALRAGHPPPVTVEDGREAVRIALAALGSLQTGQAVALPGL